MSQLSQILILFLLGVSLASCATSSSGNIVGKWQLIDVIPDASTSSEGQVALSLALNMAASSVDEYDNQGGISRYDKNGKLYAKGTYSLEDSRLMRTVNGEIEHFDITHNGDTLILRSDSPKPSSGATGLMYLRH